MLGIIFSIAIPQFSKTRENQVLKSAVNDILSSLNKAQSQTLASADSSSYGVHFQSDKVIIFNKERALSFEGNSGPYVQYTYARSNSILKKVKSFTF